MPHQPHTQLAPFLADGPSPTGSLCSSSTAPWSSSCTDCTLFTSWPGAPTSSWRPSTTPGTSSPLLGCTSGVSAQGGCCCPQQMSAYHQGAAPQPENSDPSFTVSKGSCRLQSSSSACHSLLASSQNHLPSLAPAVPPPHAERTWLCGPRHACPCAGLPWRPRSSLPTRVPKPQMVAVSSYPALGTCFFSSLHIYDFVFY